MSSFAKAYQVCCQKNQVCHLKHRHLRQAPPAVKVSNKVKGKITTNLKRCIKHNLIVHLSEIFNYAALYRMMTRILKTCEAILPLDTSVLVSTFILREALDSTY